MKTLFRVGAILFYQGKLVTTKMIKKQAEYHVVPGGGVESEENLLEALKRECKEELNIEVKEAKLVAIRELNIAGHGRGAEFYYHVSLYDGIPTIGYDPENKEAILDEVCFINRTELDNFNIVPTQLKEFLKEDYSLSDVKHLGLFNYP